MPGLLALAIDSLENDRPLYLAAIALANTNLASATTQAAQEVATTAASLATLGFDVGATLSVQGNQTAQQTHSTQAEGSHIGGQNVFLIAQGSEAEPGSVNIRGSQAIADNHLVVQAGSLNVSSAQSSTDHNQTTGQGSLTASTSLHGTASGNPVSLSGTAGQTTSDQQSVQHLNSTLVGNQILLDIDQDATVTGATVHAHDQLNAQIGGDLSVTSVQDTGQNQSQNLHGSLGQSSEGVGFEASQGEHSQTRLTSLTGQQVDISVGGNTHLGGSLIAALDAEGNDNQQLTLSTGSLSHEDLTDSQLHTQSSLGGGVQGNPDHISQANAQLGTELSASQTQQLATLSQGEILIQEPGSEASLDSLNRDINNSQQSLYDLDTGTAVDAQLDTRLLNADGWAEIAQDLDRTVDFVEDVGHAALSDSSTTVVNYWATLVKGNHATELKTFLTQNPERFEPLYAAIQKVCYSIAIPYSDRL